MTNAIQNPFFTAGSALPTPPSFETARPVASQIESRALGRFDIYDAEGHVPEIICRVILGLCLAFTFVECLIQLAAS